VTAKVSQAYVPSWVHQQRVTLVRVKAQARVALV
jgi:hypothetical protein